MKHRVHKSRGYKISKHATCKMTSLFIIIYLGKGSGETTNKNGHIFPARKGVPQFSVVTGKYNNQGIIAFTFLTMHCESLI